jgi:hypothetical protein
LRLPLVSLKKVIVKTYQTVISGEAGNPAVNRIPIKAKISRFARNGGSACLVAKAKSHDRANGMGR